MNEFHYQDCYMRYDGSRLTVGNEKIIREMDLSSGIPRTISLKDAAGREFASPEKEQPDFSFIGLNGPDFDGIVYEVTEVKAEAVEQDRFDSPHLLVCVVMREPVQDLVFRRFFAVYPGQPAIAVWNTLRTAVMPNFFWSQRSYEYNWNLDRIPELRMESCVDGFRLADSLKPRKTVEFRARTDLHDDLVFEHEIQSGKMRGNLFYALRRLRSGATGNLTISVWRDLRYFPAAGECIRRRLYLTGNSFPAAMSWGFTHRKRMRAPF